MKNPSEKLDGIVPLAVLQVAQELRKRGFQAYIVGGGVRDALIGRSVTDWDLATSAKPDQVMNSFPHVVPTGLKHGTVTVIVKPENAPPQTIEVTTLRLEGSYQDHRHPDQVIFTNDLAKDLKRRDFTINAMAWDPEQKILHDPFEGAKDLQNKTIKTVGHATDRFIEDGLRPFRAVRFAAQLDFQISDEILEAIPQTLESSRKVAVERIRDEFMKMLDTKTPSQAIETLRQTKLLELVIPELNEGVNVEQNEYHAFDVYHHSLKACDEAKGPALLKLAVLLHDIAKPRTKQFIRGANRFYGHDHLGAKMTEKIMQRLRFSNADIQYVVNLIHNHMFYYREDWTDAAVRRFIKRVGEESLYDLMDLRIADEKASGVNAPDYERLNQLRTHIDKLKKDNLALHVKNLAIGGKHVMEHLKLNPGPEVGKILNQLLEKVLDNPELNEQKKLIHLLDTLK